MLLTLAQCRAATHGIADDETYDPLLRRFEASVRESIEGYTETLFDASDSTVVTLTWDAPARSILPLPPVVTLTELRLTGTPLVLGTDYRLLTTDPARPLTQSTYYPHWRGAQRLIGGAPASWQTGLTTSIGACAADSSTWRWGRTVPPNVITAATALLRQVWDRHLAGWGTRAGGGDSVTDTVRTLLPATVGDLLYAYKEAARVHL